jgi:hypothetical protein
MFRGHAQHQAFGACYVLVASGYASSVGEDGDDDHSPVDLLVHPEYVRYTSSVAA